MNDRARARNTVERALTDIDIREDESAIERLGEAAHLLADIEGVEVDGELPELDDLLRDGEVA